MNKLIDNLEKYKKLYKQKCKELKIEKKINTYNNAKIKILLDNKNIGERDEKLVILELYHLNNMKNYDELINIFGDEAKKGIKIIDINTNKEIINLEEIKKSKGSFKSDIIIKMNKSNTIYYTSIKSKNGANPSILNHTPRSANIFNKNGFLNNKLYALDNLIFEYINKRNKHIIGEDIFLTNLECFHNKLNRKDIMDVLSFFIFDGSGKGYSKLNTNSILYFKNNQIIFIKCTNKYEKK